jgi:hypothetical protein
VSEFDNLKDKAEQYARQHPEKIREGEEAVEKKFGIGQQGQDQQGQDQSGQDNQQDQYSGDGQSGH